MLFGYVRDTVRDAGKHGKRLACILTILAVVLFTCGSNLSDALNLADYTPWFSVSTANVMAVAFFLIFFLQGDYRRGKVIPAFLIALVYLICVGKRHLIPVMPCKFLLQIFIVILSLWGLRRAFRGESFSWIKTLRPAARDGGAWLLFLAALSLPAVFLYEDGVLLYIGRGCLSTLISFGGGDAYLAVAAGMFVTAGLVSRADFYNKIVATANAFPGSILCKVLSGIGYFVGYRATGSVAVGLLVALSGFAASVATSGFTFCTVACIYERFERLQLFQTMREVIRPIISGLLITVAVSFFSECLDIGSAARWPDLCAPLLCLALTLLCALFVKKFGHKPLRMVLLCAVISILVCNGFALLV